MGNFKICNNIIEPYVEFFRFIPSIAMLTIAVVWFGIGEASKIFLITWVTLFVVIINTVAGVNSIDQNKIRAAASLGASPMQIFFFVSFPATVPYILTGMRIAMAGSFTTIVAAEMIAANKGIGALLWKARLYMLIDEIFVSLVTLSILGILVDRIFRVLIKRFAGKFSVA
jgi:NitT/TauT family transport system permease protein